MQKRLITLFLLQLCVIINGMEQQEQKELMELASSPVITTEDLDVAHKKHDSIRDVFISHAVLANQDLRNIILEYYNEPLPHSAYIDHTRSISSMPTVETNVIYPSTKGLVYTRDMMINGKIIFGVDGLFINSGPLLTSIITAQSGFWHTMNSLKQESWHQLTKIACCFCRNKKKYKTQ